MTDEVQLFNSETAENTNEELNVSELVGEGKKYRTADEALKALIHSQKHIERIEAENAELRGLTVKAKTIDDILEAVKQPVANENSDPVSNSGTDVKELIAQEVQNKLSAFEQEQALRANGKLVGRTLEARYGDKAKEVFVKKAEELGKSPVELEEMAMKDPKIVLAIFGQSPAVVNSLASTGSQRVPASGIRSYREDPEFKKLAAEGNYEKLNALYQKYGA